MNCYIVNGIVSIVIVVLTLWCVCVCDGWILCCIVKQELNKNGGVVI